LTLARVLEAFPPQMKFRTTPLIWLHILEVNKLEQKLVQILNIASSWHAILLLNEANIYLEKHNSTGYPQHNAMIGNFLRLLEYYKGILFLTTNRVTTFDDTFCSKISMFTRYIP
jgi:hypothetical protein